MEQQQDKRIFHSLRKHVDKLLAAGAAITARDPVTILADGQTLKIKHGMMVGYAGFPDPIEPAIDPELHEAVRQRAGDQCCQQLNQAISALANDASPAG